MKRNGDLVFPPVYFTNVIEMTTAGGDGDYKKLVDFLIKKERFGKMLFPNRTFASSLYKSLGGEFFAYLEEKDVKAKIAYIHK